MTNQGAAVSQTSSTASSGPARLARVAGLVGILGGAGTMHFVNPKFFDPLVPSWMPGEARTTTYVSGVFEVLAALLVLFPKSRKVGALLALATFIGVFPANIQAALDGGMKGLDPPMDSAAAAWGRLPFQFPMMWLAWLVRRDASG